MGLHHKKFPRRFEVWTEITLADLRVKLVGINSSSQSDFLPQRHLFSGFNKTIHNPDWIYYTIEGMFVSDVLMHTVWIEYEQVSEYTVIYKQMWCEECMCTVACKYI